MPITQQLDIQSSHVQHLVAEGIPTSTLAEDLLYWANCSTDVSFKPRWQNKLCGNAVTYLILQLFEDDRFQVFECADCGDTSIRATLTSEELQIIPAPNQSDTFDPDEALCEECEAHADFNI